MKAWIKKSDLKKGDIVVVSTVLGRLREYPVKEIDGNKAITDFRIFNKKIYPGGNVYEFGKKSTSISNGYWIRVDLPDVIGGRVIGGVGLSDIVKDCQGSEPTEEVGSSEPIDAAEMLWTVIANVSGGDWSKQSKEWQEAAARWRDYYFKTEVNSKLKECPKCGFRMVEVKDG